MPGWLTRWLRKPAPINPGRELNRIRVQSERALIRKTAREMRQRLGLPAHPLLEERP